MELQQLSMAELLLIGSPASLVVLFGAVLWTYYLSPYLTKKSEFKALKEDLKEITDIVEGIKTENQLKFSQIERQKNLKKEVYMEAISAVDAAASAILSASNPGKSETELVNIIQEGVRSTSKISIVASEEVLTAVISYTTAIEETWINLLKPRSVYIDIYNKVKSIESKKVQHSASKDLFIENFKNLRATGHRDQDTHKNHDDVIRYEMDEINRLDQELAPLCIQSSREGIKFKRLCSDRFSSIVKMKPALVLAMRRDLEMTVDEESYTKIIMESHERGEANFNDFLTSYEKLLGDTPPAP